MKKILFFMFLVGVLFVGSVVHADTYTNIYAPNWTYNGNALNKIANYDDMVGFVTTVKAPQIYTFSSDIQFAREPYLARFHVVLDASYVQNSNVVFSNCNEQGYCTTANIFEYKEPVSVNFSMNQEGLRTYCSISSGQATVGGFIIDCPISHKTKHISGLNFEIIGGPTNGFTGVFGISKTVTFIYTETKDIVNSINSLNDDLKTKLNTTNSTLATINNTIGGLPKAIYNYFETDLSQIKQNLNSNSQKQIETMNANSKKEIEATNKNTQATQQQTDYLKDDTAPTSDISALGNVTGVFPPGPLDSLLNIPFEFLSILTSSFSGTCVPITGTWVFEQTFTIPCFSEMFYSKVPTLLMTFIDLLPATFILIKYFKHLYKKIDRAMSMETNSDDEWGVI